ncbi:MAG TPA: hypothetical protein VFQ61_31010, partial [Polyangiaceae bacterium]|nr:hypothetical protein [Polyangiaceae bacterium]
TCRRRVVSIASELGDSYTEVPAGAGGKFRNECRDPDFVSRSAVPGSRMTRDFFHRVAIWDSSIMQKRRACPARVRLRSLLDQREPGRVRS